MTRMTLNGRELGVSRRCDTPQKKYLTRGGVLRFGSVWGLAIFWQ